MKSPPAPAASTLAPALALPSCEEAIAILTHLYLELRMPVPQALRAAKADWQGAPPCPPDGEVDEPPVAPAENAPAAGPTTLAYAPGPADNGKSSAPMGLVIAAFAAVYVIWGSTYLGIRVAIETIPPLLMAGIRSLSAGLLLFGGLWACGVPKPTRTQWRSALIVGALLLFAGNGGVTWAEQRVPSSLTALIVATVPLWMIVLEWLRPGGSGRPRPAVFGGLALGFAGVALIVLSKDQTGHRTADPVGVAVLLVAALCWAVGSVYSKHLPQASNPLMAVAAQMIAGGGLMFAGGVARGEAAGFHLASVSDASALALAYLVFVGSLVGFTAYVWLLRVSTPARVSTYAYVNPLIAVLLGWSVGHEPITGGILLAGSLIIGAVVLITTSRASVARQGA